MSPINTSVLLIYTGGTIGMIENAATGVLENFNFEQLQKHIPELQKFNFPIDTYQFDPPMQARFAHAETKVNLDEPSMYRHGLGTRNTER